MIYLFLVNIALTIGLGLYQLCFRKLTFFQWNRVYLLGVVVLSLLVPIGLFIDISGFLVKDEIIPHVDLNEVMDIMYVPISSARSSYSFMDFLSPLYWTGVVVCFFILANRLWNVRKAFVRKEDYVSFSFFKNVFLGSKVRNEQVIDRHEQVHVEQGHSYDVILLEIICVFSWFNPVVYLIRKELKFQHECIADELCSDNKVAYAELLVANAMRTDVNSLVHEFSNQSFLKKRIIMLFKNKSSNKNKFFYLASVPVLLIIVSSTLVFNTSRAKEVVANVESSVTDFNFSKVGENTKDVMLVQDEADKKSKTEKVGHLVQEGELVEKPEVSAEPPGGMAAFRRWIGENYQYAKEAIDAGIKGTIEVSFVVEKNGSLSQLKVKEKLGHGTDEAALTLLRKSPKWSPAIHNGKAVRTAFSLPIRLDLTTLQKEKDKNVIFTEVENVPEPPNGMPEFRKWIGANYQYPSDAIDAGVKGTIRVQFIVEKDGSLSNIKSTEDIGSGTGEAAVNLLLKSPKWKPGIQNGRTVRVEYILPIRLDLTNM